MSYRQEIVERYFLLTRPVIRRGNTSTRTQIFGTPDYAHTISLTTNRFCIATNLERGVFYGRQPRHRISRECIARFVNKRDVSRGDIARQVQQNQVRILYDDFLLKGTMTTHN